MGGRMKPLGNFVKLPHNRDTPKRMWLCLADVYLGITQHMDGPLPLSCCFRGNFAKRLIFSKKNQKDNTPSENKARNASKAVICTKLVTRKQMLL